MSIAFVPKRGQGTVALPPSAGALMRTFVKPRAVFSKCLGFAACRYDGAIVADEFASRLRAHVAAAPVCPEMEIGLGCPRDPIRVVRRGGRVRLVQPATGRDVSGEMVAFASRFLASLGEVDGFLLKARSPSCGITDVKVYGGPGAEAPLGAGSGFFGGAVLRRFTDLPVEDEGRLNNIALREHFLTRLFAMASLRGVGRRGGMRDLAAFHAANEWLLAAYSRSRMRELGRLAACAGRRPSANLSAAYRRGFARALARPPRTTSIINVLMHALRYVSAGLKAGEKAFFLDLLEKYRAGKAPLSAALTLVRSWGVRFEVACLMQQTFLEPYPEALAETFAFRAPAR